MEGDVFLAESVALVTAVFWAQLGTSAWNSLSDVHWTLLSSAASLEGGQHR